MELDQLRTFLTILDQGSFTRAASVLHLSQSTVSFQIKNLESEVGVRILDRRRERVVVTTAGKLLATYARELIALRDEALSRIRAPESSDLGELRIAASTIAAEYLLPPALASLRRLHPLLPVTVDTVDSHRAIELLVAKQCDVALVGAKRKEPRVRFTPFAEDEIVLAGAQQNPGSPPKKPRSRDWARVAFVLRKEGSGTRAAIDSLLEQARVEKSARMVLEVGSTEMAKRCVLEGLGVTFISRLAIRSELRAGLLEIVPFPGTPVRRDFFSAVLRGIPVNKAVSALIRVLSPGR